MPEDKPFMLFSCCIPVKGAERSVLCDLQRQTAHFIPEGLFEILTLHEGKTAAQLKAAYQHRFDEIIGEYFQFLEKGEFIFFTDTPERFPKMDLRWEEPRLITNAIIDIGEVSLPWENMIGELEQMGCGHIHIRSFSDKQLGFFEALLPGFEGKRIESIVLTIKFQPVFEERALLAFCRRFPRLSTLEVHSVPAGHPLFSLPARESLLFITEEKISSGLHCGFISPAYFTINVKTFTEALRYNSCLNRKISIDSGGEIRNCPSMPQSHGNIRETRLSDALEKPEFRKYWNITKDQIRVCRDCEFRYICTDCRAFLEEPADSFSKPLKCGYNPYTCEWEEWSTNPLKHRAAEYYGMESLPGMERG